MTTAPDLLVVIFTPESGRAERAAVAKSVGGKLLGQVASEPGALLPQGAVGRPGIPAESRSPTS